MSTERFIHFIIGLVFVAVYIAVANPTLRTRDWLAIVLFSALGAWVPDWDLYLGGIGAHRSPFTHSMLPWIALWIIGRNTSKPALVGFALGLSSHLLMDTVIYGDVRLIAGGNNDRIFLVVNAVIGLIAAGWTGANVQRRFSDRQTTPEMSSSSSKRTESNHYAVRRRFVPLVRIFVPTLFVALLINQSFFGWCLKLYCIKAALPHVAVLSIVATWYIYQSLQRSSQSTVADVDEDRK